MNIRTLLVPVVATALISVAPIQEASAAPTNVGVRAAQFGGARIGVDLGLTIPLGHRTRVHRARRVRHAPIVVPQVVQPRGYWKTIQEPVFHPRELVGYDSHGHAVYSPAHTDYVERRIWVPAPVVVAPIRRYVAPRYVAPRRYRVRPRGHISVGFGGSWRIR